jgi:hypothetical protein
MNGTFNRLLDGAPYVAPAPPPSGDAYAATVCLIGAPDVLRATFDDVCAVPVPESTIRADSGNESYSPLPYKDLMDATRSIFAERLNLEPLSESYALARGGKQMFAKVVFPFNESQGYSVVVRSSYNRTISNQVGCGLNTFVCANGMFRGTDLLKLKHTSGSYERIPAMLREMADRTPRAVREMAERLASWGDVPMADTFFYAYAGIALGLEYITPSQHSSALKYWRACQSGDLHDAHGTPTLSSGFQALTGGLHRAPPQSVFQQFAQVDDLTGRLADSGGSALTEVPAFTLEIEDFE